MLAPWKKSYDKPRHHFKKQRHYFADKIPSSQSYSFSSSHVQMWEMDHKESWAAKNWCFWTVDLEKTLESPWDCKEIIQSWIFIKRTDVEPEAPIIWPPDAKTWLIRPWCLEGLKAGEGDDRERDFWMALPSQLTWAWACSRRSWRTGNSPMLQLTGTRRVRHDWAIEQQKSHIYCPLLNLFVLWKSLNFDTVNNK